MEAGEEGTVEVEGEETVEVVAEETVEGAEVAIDKEQSEIVVNMQ